MERSRAGRVGSKKSKSIPAPPYGVGLKSRRIPVSPTLRGGETRIGQNGEGWVKLGGTKLSSLVGICVTPHFATLV